MKTKFKKKKQKVKKSSRSKYQQGGGMYAENVIPAGLGSTAMTVYQEDNPALQQQRMEALEKEKEDAMQQSEEMAKEIEADKEGDKAAATAASQEAQGKMEAGMQTLGLASQTADAAGLFGKGAQTAAQESAKDKQSLVGALRSAKDIYSATRQAKKSMKLVQDFNKAKVAFDVKRRLDMGEQAWQMQQNFKKTKDIVEGGKEAFAKIREGAMNIQPGAGKGGLDLVTKSKDLLAAPELSVKMGKDGFLQASQKTSELAKGSAVGKGLKDFATSGAGIGLMASGAGFAAKKIWGDDDDTKYNAGEVAGDILSGVGSGMSTAALLGSVVPGVGNVAGAIVG